MLGRFFEYTYFKLTNQNQEHIFCDENWARDIDFLRKCTIAVKCYFPLSHGVYTLKSYLNGLMLPDKTLLFCYHLL